MSVPGAPQRPRSSRSTAHPPGRIIREAGSSSQATTHTTSRTTTAAQLSASATSVRRNLFKSLRSAGNTISGSKEKKATQLRRAMTLDEDEEESSDEDIVERDRNGDIMLNMPELIVIDDQEEADILERARMADSMNRPEAVADKANITEVLRRAVANLDDDNWMFEAEDDF